MKQNNTFANSGLGRTKPRKHRFFSLLKRHKSETGLIEDRTSSVAIVRIIIGLLLLHLVIIGGVLLKGHFDKMALGANVPQSLTPPPVADEVIPQPAAVAVETPAVAPTPAKPAEAAQPAQAATASSGGTHITQAGAGEVALFPEDDAPAVATPAPTPVVVTPPVIAPTPAQQAAEPTPAPTPAAEPTTTIKYLVNSGDTWYGVASKHGVSIDALKAANPTAARKPHLFQGTYINVPVKADSAAAQAAAATAPPAPAAKTYTIKRGDTLAKIARKHKMTVPALMKLNNLTEKDARRIRPGQELKVAE